jgi:hypothetical protein
VVFFLFFFFYYVQSGARGTGRGPGVAGDGLLGAA